MRKRFTAMLLCAVMILPTFLFSSCGGGARSTYRQVAPVTITLYTIAEEGTTEEGVASIQNAINNYTENNFGTHVVLKMFSADEYAEILDERLSATAVPAETTVVDDTDEETADDTAEETKKKEETRVYKRKEDVKYEEPKENQVNIFLINSVDMFNTYCTDGILRGLDDYLASEYSVLYKFINPVLMKAAVYLPTGSHYAIPNNHTLGEYEYILFNKELMQNLGYYKDDIHTILQLSDFAADVKASAPGYTPILDTYGIEPLAVKIDGAGDFYGAYVGHGATGETSAMPKSLLENGKFLNEYSTLHELRANGTMVDGELPAPGEASTTKAAAILVKGDINLPAKYEDEYEVAIYKYPTATNENTYCSMYGITAVSDQTTADRCMEILNALQTDAKFRNIFQYGKKGTDYEYTTDDIIEFTRDGYVVNPIYTGNQFILYQNTDMTEDEFAMSEDGWKAAKKQNTEMVASPYCGFSALTTAPVYEDASSMTTAPKTPEEMMSDIKNLSDDFNKRIKAYNGGEGEAFKTFLGTLATEMKENKSVKNAGKTIFTNAPLAMYNAWYKMMYKPEEEAAETTAAATTTASETSNQ